jgi:hypothetical protein
MCTFGNFQMYGEPALQALQLSRWLSEANSQAGQAYVVIPLMSALWRVDIMLVLNRSLLNREYTLINLLKALASIISMCNLHVTLLSKIIPIYLQMECFVQLV